MDDITRQAKNEVTAMIKKDPGHALTLLQNMLQKKSVNPWFSSNYPQGEEEAQAVVEEEMRRLGAEVRLWEPSAENLKEYANGPGYYADHKFDHRPNLAAFLRGSQKHGHSLLLLGHIDVVEPGDNWTVPPFSGEIKEGKIYGRGAADMKGGLAAQIAALGYIKRAGYRLKGDVIVGSVVDEEAGGMGTLAFVAEGYRSDAAIIGEPTNLVVAPLCRGILWGKITIPGRNSHIELPQTNWRAGGGVDAIEKAKLYLEHIDHLNHEWEICKKHPLMDIPCQIKVAMINAGDYPTTYASKAEIVVNIQYLPSEKDENGLGGKVKSQIEDWVKKIAATDDWLSEHPPIIEWMIDANCGETPETHPVVTILAENIRAVRPKVGTDVIKGVHCHTDMGFLTDRNIPTVNFGPGMLTVCHQPDEHIEVADYLEAVEIMAGTIIDWCGAEVDDGV
jgi:acetylornithine deacetylase